MKVNETLKLTLIEIFIFCTVSYIWIWTNNFYWAMMLGTVFLIPFLLKIFEIKKFFNRKLYLTISVIILSFGVISAVILILNQDQIQDKVLISIVAGLLIVITFNTAFSGTHDWKKD